MTEKLVALQIWIGRRAEARGDQGQGALEYVGAIVIAAAVVVAVAGAFKVAAAEGRPRCGGAA